MPEKEKGIVMKIKMNEKLWRYDILCMITLLVTLFPVSCSYIMSGGVVEDWISRIAELAEGFRGGQFYLFPTVESFVDSGNRMNSNFWFLVPGILYWGSANMVFSYRIFMLIIQAGTLLASMLFFQKFFADRETKLPVFFGVLLYMTCPYRIYICYDLADISQAVVWMLLPLYAWAVMEILCGHRRCGMVTAAVTLAGIGYADMIFFIILAVVALFAGVAARKVSVLASVFMGAILFSPGIIRLSRYLFLGQFAEWNMPLQSIMKNGYRLGEYFGYYTYSSGHPGMGLGMFVCVIAVLWLQFAGGIPLKDRKCIFYTAAALFFLLLSWNRFPWDFIQRLGMWALKLVSLVETPALFAGVAFGCLCIPGADAVDRMYRQGQKAASAVALLVLIACLGICIYQCNMLTFYRLPLTLS